MLSHFVLVAFFLKAGLIACSSFVDTGDNAAYSWGYAYPQSCTCAETGVALSKCDLFKCDCICDITAGKCDYNCCCDPDCSVDQVSRFKTLNSCAVEGISDTTQYCYSTEHLSKINPRKDGQDGFILSGQTSAQAGVHEALCIEKKNIATKSEFFNGAAMQPVTVFDTTSGQKLHSYVEDITELVPDAFYDQNDTLPVFVKVGGVFSFADGSKFLRLPTADFTGACSDANYAVYEAGVLVTDNSCIRQIDLPTADSSVGTVTEVLTAQCEDMNSVSRYITSLYVGTLPNVGFGTAVATSTNTVPITITSMIHLDFYSGVETDVTTMWSAENSTCATALYDTYEAYVTDTDANGGSGGLNENCTASSTTNSLTIGTTRNSPICFGFVTSVVYTVNHDQSIDGTITSVTAAVKFTDLPLVSNSTTNAENTNPVTNSVFIQQSFGTTFNDEGAGTNAHNNEEGNVVNRTRSGNPGYIIGLPVLYGFAETSTLNQTVISERVDGMFITGPVLNTVGAPADFSLTAEAGTSVGLRSGISAKTTCPSVSDTLSAQAMKFGYDVSTGCTLHMNRDALASMCSDPSTSIYVNPDTLLPYFLDFTNGSLGIFGNADPLDVSQWLSIERTTATSTDSYTGSVTWNDAASTCIGFPTGLNIRLLVAYSGEKTNPQNKIISASYEYTTMPMRMRTSSTNNITLQSFGMTTTVSFIFKDHTDFIGYKPPAPPLLFQVPHDVFYPFVQNSAGRQPNAGTRGTWSLSMISILLSCFAACLLSGII